jgi:hypothetical protein
MFVEELLLAEHSLTAADARPNAAKGLEVTHRSLGVEWDHGSSVPRPILGELRSRFLRRVGFLWLGDSVRSRAAEYQETGDKVCP